MTHHQYQKKRAITITRMHLRWLAPTAAIALLGTGCLNGDSSPKSCDATIGAYLEFRTNKCVIPTDHETLYRLYLYRRLEALDDRDIGTLLHQVALREWSSRAEVEKLISDPRFKVEQLVLFFPTVSGGLRVPVDLAPTSPVSGVLDQAEAKVLLSLQPVASDLGDEFKKLQTAVLAHNYKVAIIRLRAKPRDLSAWWRANDARVRFIQPFVTDTDYAQRQFDPTDEAP